MEHINWSRQTMNHQNRPRGTPKYTCHPSLENLPRATSNIALYARNLVHENLKKLREREGAKNKDDIRYGTAQARLKEDEAVRVVYKHGTPLEGGKTADSEPVDLFSSARNIQKSCNVDQDQNEDPTPQLHHHPHPGDDEQGGGESNTKGAKFPSKKPPPLATK